jgi:hypothetical protein
MNLIQIQDKLKSLPNDPRVMQLLTGYANGQSPLVPPYVALGELNRRKVENERKQMEQAGQPPGGTVKDQIEQQAGVMALKQGQQQQAMQNMMRQGMSGAAPVPQNTPQPQAQGQVMAAAGGGLASLAPKGYRSGGIIAFKEGNLVDPEAETEDEDEEKSTGEYATDAKAMLARLMQEAAARRSMKAPTAESPMEARKRMIAENPEEFGILSTPVGQDAMQRLDEVQGAKRAELATQREELAKSKPGILQLLGQAAMGTRGQKGGSALASILGGYSELASGAEAKQLQQEQGLRMRELELQQAKAEALNKIDDLKRARAEGDIAAEQKAKMELAKIAKDHNVSLNTLLRGEITAAGSVAGRESAAQIAAKAKVDAAKFKDNKPEKLTDLGSMIDIEFRALVANGADPDDPNTKRIAAQNAARALSKSAGTTRADTDAIDKANTAFENKVLTDRNLRKLRTTDPAAYEARLEELRKEVETRFKVRPDADSPLGGNAPAAPSAKPAATSAKPAADGKVMTMADVRATAKANNKTEAEVIAAAKAKGFKIQ